MWTMHYRGTYIHGYCDKEECWYYMKGTNIYCKSLHAAKCRITKGK